MHIYALYICVFICNITYLLKRLQTEFKLETKKTQSSRKNNHLKKKSQNLSCAVYVRPQGIVS